jgi:hypothetical protein
VIAGHDGGDPHAPGPAGPVAVLDLGEEARRVRPALGEIPAAWRCAAQRTWRLRMVNEHGSAPVFAGLARQLRRAGDDARADRASPRGARDRRRRRVASPRGVTTGRFW